MKIMIFSPNIIPTVKTYYYEIIFDSLVDITLFKNNKKFEFLDKIGYDLGNCMEFSLEKYLKFRKSFGNGGNETGSVNGNSNKNNLEK